MQQYFMAHHQIVLLLHNIYRDVIEIYRNNEEYGGSGNEAPSAIISTTLSSDGNYAGIAGASSVNALWAASPFIENPALICDNVGNVGIGTTDPSYNLDLYDGNMRLLYKHEGIVKNNFLTFERSSYDDCRINHYCDNQISAQIDFNGYSEYAQSTIQFSTKENGGSLTNRMSINYNGFVGIGQMDPYLQLHVTENIFISHTYNNNRTGWRIWASWSGISTETENLYFYVIRNGGTSTEIGYLEDDHASVGKIDFTGQHRSILNKNIDKNSVGLIVSSNGKYINLDNTLHAKINECLPICNITNIDNDIKVFGVISDKEDTNNNRAYNSGKFVSSYEKTNKNEQRMFINSLGEGAIWVCNKNGNLVNGDYISSSSAAGYGMRQNTNKLLNSTVAKITCDCDFSLTKIVKQKLKVITTTETYEENVFEKIEKTNTKNVIEYDEELSRYVQKEITNTTTEEEQVYDTVDLYNEDGEVIGTHQVERKITKTKIITEIDYDNNGNVQYEDDLDENGNQQMIYPYETRFLLPDGTQITEIEYNNKKSLGEIVYLACFVGCTYHCG